jgi:hypothetical protein
MIGWCADCAAIASRVGVLIILLGNADSRWVLDDLLTVKLLCQEYAA